MLKLKVPDMSCGHCASTIEKAVRSLDPTADVTVDLRSQTVTVGSKLEPTAISDSIASAGYENEKLPA